MPHRPQWKRCWRETLATWRFRRMPATNTTPSRRPIRIFKKRWRTSRITAHRVTGTTAAAIPCTAKAYTRSRRICAWRKRKSFPTANYTGSSKTESASLACRPLPAPWISGRLETGTLHSAFAATDDGRTPGDGARQPEGATRTRERLSLVRVGALSKRPPTSCPVFNLFASSCVVT
jgi:hypothetical protein